VRDTAAESPTPPPLLARPTAMPGPAFQLFAVLQHRDDRFIYDRSKPLLSVDRVKDIAYDPRSRESSIVLLAANAKKLASITKQHGGETLLVISGNRLMVQWPVRVPVNDGFIRISSRPDTADIFKSFTNEVRDYHK
jgi:hypothetical protein